jgi:hypothetical protein
VTAAPNRASGARVKNCLRDFDMFLLKPTVVGSGTNVYLIGKIHYDKAHRIVSDLRGRRRTKRGDEATRFE